MKIGIDCRLSGTQHAGLGRYTTHLVNELIKSIKKNDELVLFFSSQKQATEVVPRPPKSCAIVISPVQHYSLKEQFVLPWYFYNAHLDVLHVPHFNVPLLYFGTLVVTIHDLLWHEKKGVSVTTLSPFVYWVKYFFYHVVTRNAVQRAHTICVPSKTVAKTVTKQYPKAEKKIVITKEGAHLLPTKQKITKKKHQILYVGSLYPHKNIQLVIDALKQLPKTQLLIVGSRNVFQDKVKKYVTDRHLQHQVSFLGFVNDEKLSELYAESTALVQPSLSEGFGLTGLEALSLKTPVLASDIPIFHEVYGQAAHYFNPHSVEDFIKAYQSLSKQSQKTFMLLAEQTTAEYSWKKMARTTYQTYTNAYEGK